MTLNNSQLNAITQQVYQKFPELKGSPPQVHSQSKSPGASDHYLIVFKSKTADNIIRVVRVTTDAKGRVLKMSTSR